MSTGFGEAMQKPFTMEGGCIYRNKTNPRLLTFQNLTVQDGKLAVIQDLGTQFFLREEDLGKNRSVLMSITNGTIALLLIDILFDDKLVL